MGAPSGCRSSANTRLLRDRGGKYVAASLDFVDFATFSTLCRLAWRWLLPDFETITTVGTNDGSHPTVLPYHQRVF